MRPLQVPTLLAVPLRSPRLTPGRPQSFSRRLETPSRGQALLQRSGSNWSKVEASIPGSRFITFSPLLLRVATAPHTTTSSWASNARDVIRFRGGRGRPGPAATALRNSAIRLRLILRGDLRSPANLARHRCLLTRTGRRGVLRTAVSRNETAFFRDIALIYRVCQWICGVFDDQRGRMQYAPTEIARVENSMVGPVPQAAAVRPPAIPIA